MAIRFRFRSSVNYDSVDIEGRPSISVGDLKSKIVRNKNLNICQDFDLLFSDALTGQEYHDENFQLPRGSSVIIKRVPKGSVHSDLAHAESFDNVRVKDTNVVKTSAPVIVDTDNFDDFGAELCPIPEATTSGSDLDADKMLYFTTEKTTSEVSRCFERPLVECQKPEASELSESIQRGLLHIDDHEDISQLKSKPRAGEFTKPEMLVNANPQDIENVDLPAELKCSLCDTFFKDALMIPCCQHSFCEKCIHAVLMEKGRCPKCLSTKCKVEDLLPNISLRQAIRRFLESQIVIRSSDNAFGYAPDGESGIQVKEMSCAASIQKREAQLCHSPCSAGRGSNQNITSTFGGKSSLSHKLRQIDAEKHGPKHPVYLERQPEDSSADCQGENKPMHEEAESTIKKKRALHDLSAGVDRSYIEIGRYRKGDRTCYMCGSLDHFIRDCPSASSPHPMLKTGNNLFPGAMAGYLSPYWNGVPFPQMRPFVNPYGNHFNATMFPPTAYAVPNYMPSMYGGMAPYGGFARMDSAAATVGPSTEWHLDRSDCRRRIGYEKREKLSHENLMRGQFFDGNDEDDDFFNKRHHSNEEERSLDSKSHRDRDDNVSRMKDSFTERPHRKRQHHNQFHDELERSSSEVEDMSSSSNWHSEGRHKHHHRNPKKHDGGRERGGGDSSHSHHRPSKAKDVKRKTLGPDANRNKRRCHSQTGSGFDPSSSGDQKTQCKERDSSHGSRNSRHNSRSTNNELSHERWQMVSRSDEDTEEDYHYHKRKRHH